MTEKIILTIYSDKGDEKFLYNQDKTVKIGDYTYSFENNIFKIYNQSGRLILTKSYQLQNPDVYRNDYDNLYYLTQKQGDYIKQAKGQFPVINARVPTGVGLDFQKPDRYQSTYNPQDNFLRTAYLGPLQMVQYDPINCTMEKVDPILDESIIAKAEINGQKILDNYPNVQEQFAPGYGTYVPPVIQSVFDGYDKYLQKISGQKFY